MRKKNQEVNLPENLNIDIITGEFPPLVDKVVIPIRNSGEKKELSWVQVVSKGKESDNLNSVINDRCFLEC